MKSKQDKIKHKKPSTNWFNDYQRVEDFLIEKLGHDEYVKIDFSKCVSASDSTILIIKKLIEKK